MLVRQLLRLVRPASHLREAKALSTWNPVKLYREHSPEELTAIGQALRADPENANPAHKAGSSIFLFNQATQKKLDAIAWAITYHLDDKRKARAN